MRGLVLLPLLLVAAPERARASGCTDGIFSTTMYPPAGCGVVVYDRYSDPSSPPTIYARRASGQYDVTGMVTSSSLNIEVTYQNYDCDGGLIIESKSPEQYAEFRVTLVGAQPGDELYADYFSLGTVGAPGPCVEEPLQKPYCTSRNSGYPCPGDPGTGDAGVDDDDKQHDGGCNAAGSAGLALVALFAHLFRRRRS